MLAVNKRPDSKIIRVDRIQDALMLCSEQGMIKLEPKSSEIIRVLYTLRDKFSDHEKPGIIATDTYSDWHYDETEREIRLHTSMLTLKVNKATASIKYFDGNGKLLLKERDFESKNLEEFDSYKTITDENSTIVRVVTPDGIKEVVKDAAKVFDQKLYKTRLYLEWQEEEALYGLGQHEEGYLNLRGTTAYLHQANKKIAIPFLVSSLGYGILVDTYSPMIFNDTNFGSYLYTEADYEMDFYFINGSNLDGVVRCYRYLTGKAVMLPKWAFGFVQSQERYETAKELNDVVKEYRQRNIGLDCIVLDWCSWVGDLWGQKTFDQARFADPTAMMEELHENHANLMVSIWPNMSKDCDNYKEFEEKKLLLQASSIYDPYTREGRDLYWKQTKEGLFNHGIDAWWCDSSEPFTPEWNHLGTPEAITMYQEFFDTSSQYIPAQLTNSYGLYHARTIYEGQRGVTSEKRVVNLTRNGYTGQQRYGTILWSGDISANWITMKRQITAGLNFCVSGIPYWTLDIGAFFVKKGIQWFWDGDYEKGYDDLGYRELFTRWFQYGCFLPVFRSHGTDFRRELKYFGDQGDLFYDALIKVNHLRYQLMPYIYSIAARVWKDDYTMLRMLAFDFAEDARARVIDDQFLFGSSLMVCPVTTPMYYEKDSLQMEGTTKAREVYLPKGTGWYDFWTNQYYEGGQTILAKAPIDIIPLYVKAGSILPMTQFMNYVDEIPEAPIEVRIYTGKDTEFELYEDEGNSYRYEEGAYVITKFEWSENDQKLHRNDPIGNYYGMMKDREYKVQVINNAGKKNDYE
ncbi:MAG: glycoside hydrolase family 31 [Herbinix sp.]|nr:glycoside hydrolase family 31 [Herbinix sp.]